MSWLFKLLDSAGTNQAGVDSNGNVKVNGPTTPSQAGYQQTTYVANSSNTKGMQVTEDGGVVNATHRPLIDLDFNSAATLWTPKIGTNATTHTKIVTNGYMRLNNGASVATTTGIAIYTWQILNVFHGRELRLRFNIKHTNAAATNKQMEWGMGYYNFAAGQANGMNEFIGFRITAGGVLQGVLAYTTGGAPTETTVTVNGGTPYTDGENKVYEVRISHRKIEYWADGTLWNTISIATDVYSIIKATGYPAIARVFNSGVPSAAPILYVGQITAYRLGADADLSHAAICATQGKGSLYWQPDLGMAANTHNAPASGTAPTAATGSNVASVLNTTAQMGGFYRMNGASFNVVAHSNVEIAAFQNPTIPTANGAGNDGRIFYVTSIKLSPQVITTALTGGPYTAIWFAAFNSSAISLATADADGTTAMAARAPRIFPLPRVVSFAAAAALGTLETGAGDFTVDFPTPEPIYPGLFLVIGQRLLTVTAVTAGTIDGGIYVNGYWE